uniref:SUEL-type lectin domain-containing protein n=1 Tax=Salarias fasciatus TaxID=181472 RepID=A0A672HAV1_SALFA
ATAKLRCGKVIFFLYSKHFTSLVSVVALAAQVVSVIVFSAVGQVISILEANYGRLESGKCAKGRPKSQLRNVKCSNPASKVSETCDGKRSCNIRASNSMFGDPCRGTYKYLEVDYVCQEPEPKPREISSVTCEGSRAQLKCGKVISVVKANYGRLDSKKCSRRRPGLRLFSPTQVCILRCNGKRRCSIRAVNSVFGDPCRGTYKYLEVDYVCQGEQLGPGRSGHVSMSRQLSEKVMCVPPGCH